MKNDAKKAMSDGEVNDFVYKKLMGDMDHIEASGMFDEGPAGAPQSNTDGVKMEAGGYSIHVKPMEGEQTQDRPSFKEEKEEQEGEFGK